MLMLYGDPGVRGDSLRRVPGQWPHLIAASAMNLGVWNIATSLAVLYIPSGHASVLAYTMPLWVAVSASPCSASGSPAACWLAIVIGAAAVAALMTPNFHDYAQAPLGLFWGLWRASAGRSAPSS